MGVFSGILKGSVVVTVAKIASSACGFLLFWIISQNSVIRAGEFRTIFIFFLFCELLPLLGMNQFIIRNVSTHPNTIKKHLFHSALFSMVVTAFIVIGLYFVYAHGSYSATVSKGLLIVAVGMPATALVLCLQSILIGAGKSDRYGLLQGAEAIIRALAGASVFIYYQDVLILMTAFVICRWVIVFVYYISLPSFAETETWRFDPVIWRHFLKHVPQFAGILILFLIVRFSSQLMIPWMKGDADAAYFAVSYQFLDLILLIPSTLAVNLIPVFSKKASESINALQTVCSRALKLIAMIIVPSVVFVSINAKPLILLIFGKSYANSIMVLQMVVWAGLIFSVDMILSTTMIACNRQDLDLKTLFVGSIAMLACLYACISVFGLIGAGIGLCAGIMVLFLARIVFFIGNMFRLNLFPLLWRMLAAGFVMAVSMKLFDAGLFCNIFIAAVSYSVVLLISGAMNAKERTSLGLLLQSK